MRPVARIAQSVEQGIENPRVRGSIPRPGTNILKTQPLWLGFCFLGKKQHWPLLFLSLSQTSGYQLKLLKKARFARVNLLLIV